MHVPGSTDANVRQAVPFFWVRDIHDSLRFYVDGLGFAKTREWLENDTLRWCWLELGGAALMLQEFWRAGPHQNVPAGDVGVGVTINFICQDAIALWRDFTRRGIPARQPFVGNGMWVTGLKDPDGYDLVFESPTDAPEESTHAEPDAE